MDKNAEYQVNGHSVTSSPDSENLASAKNSFPSFSAV